MAEYIRFVDLKGLNAWQLSKVFHPFGSKSAFNESLRIFIHFQLLIAIDFIWFSDELISLQSKTRHIDCNCLVNCDDHNFFVKAYVSSSHLLGDVIILQLLAISFQFNELNNVLLCILKRFRDRELGSWARIFNGELVNIRKCNWNGI